MIEKPLYNIGVVTRLTGIPAASLYAWERRYHFPDLARTPGGHRLYSQEDIASLVRVRDLIASGRKASLAIEQVRRGQAAPLAPLPISSQSSSPALGHIRQALSKALSQGDLAAADRLFAESITFHSPETLVIEVIQPVMEMLGTSWQQGELSVADEHLASAYLRHRLLRWIPASPQDSPTPPIVLACVPGEWHDGGLLMLGVLLRRQAWPLSYLGQNVPYPDLADFVHRLRPAALVLTAMQPGTAAELGRWPDWIKPAHGSPLVAFGGRPFSRDAQLAARTPGLYLGDTLQQGFIRLTEALAGLQPPG